jgi:hypothetical protein
MSHYETLYPARFLKKEALPKPKTIRVLALTATQLEGERGVEPKVVMKYKAADGEGEIVLCKTNAKLIEHVLGTPEYEQWIGKLVTIYNNPNVDLKGKKVGGIRIFGGPDMTKAVVVKIKRPRRKDAEIYKLVPTGKNVSAAAMEPEPDADESPPPPSEDFGDEAGAA